MHKKRILITAALPYANGPLHFGHIAGAYLPADVYARFQRLQGQEVLFICGSDEYGVAITLSAEMAGRTPKEHVDLYHAINEKFFQQLEISFDHFSRTTWPGHNVFVQQFFNDLNENGYIEAKVTDQLYSERDHKFLADRYVVGTCPKCGFTEARGDECQRCGASYEATDLLNPRSKLTNAPLIRKPTKHWFMRFDLFKEKLSNWLATKQDWKPNVLNFAKTYVNDLKPRAITRDGEWGVPVPLPKAKGKVLYVWFDAPIGYISATADWAQKKGHPDAWKPFWLESDTKYVEFVGKDNIPFHAIFFPAMVMGQNLPYKLVDQLPANEFLNLEGKQFSKSEGWTIDLENFFRHFTADQIRYTLAANAPETQDSEFTWKDFQARCNAELLAKFGNLAQRTLVFAAQHCHGKIPSMHELQESDRTFLEKIPILAQEAQQAYETFHLRRASQIVMELAQHANVYFDAKKPWKAAKEPAQKNDMETTIAACIEALKVLALIACPIIPDTAEKLWKLLGNKTPLNRKKWRDVMDEKLPSGQVLPPPEVLFQRVEDSLVQTQIDQLKAAKPQEDNRISIDDVKKVELRVGQILHAEPVPKSKKLLKLSVDLGTETRTIVSGIALAFPDLSVLIGKKVIVITNLKPAVLMGVESNGMILAASLEGGLELPELKQAKPGDVIS